MFAVKSEFAVNNDLQAVCNLTFFLILRKCVKTLDKTALIKIIDYLFELNITKV